MNSRNDDPLIQEDFDPSPSQQDGDGPHSSGRFATEDEQTIAKKKRQNQIITYVAIVLVVGIIGVGGFHMMKHPTSAPVVAKTSTPKAKVLKKKAPSVSTLASTSSVTPNPTSMPGVTAVNGPAVFGQVGPDGTQSLPVVAPDSTPPVTNDLSNNPLFASAPANPAPINPAPINLAPVATVPVVSVPVNPEPVASVSTLTPVNNGSTVVTPEAPSIVTAPPASVVVVPVVTPNSTPSVDGSMPATSAQVDHISTQVDHLDNRITQIDQRVSRLEDRKSLVVAPLKEKKSSPHTSNSVKAKVHHVRDTPSHQSHHYKSTPKNSIEILSNSNASGVSMPYQRHSSNRIHSLPSPESKLAPTSTSSWSQSDTPVVYSVSAIKDGRAWLKSPDGSFTTVMSGSSLPDGRKITKVDENNVWIDGKKFKR